jgi:O-antigen/teichoic acid export membrane protein
MENEQQKPGQLSPASLVGSIFKFSIATWVNAAVLLATTVIATYVLGSGVYGMYNLFYQAAFTVMNITALGLDFAYIRFYNSPPRGISDRRRLAAACMGCSALSLAAASVVACAFFPEQIGRLFFGGDAGMSRFTVLICLNAFFLLVTRYFNITYRMQQNAAMYTVQSILLNFFSRSFFIVGALFGAGLDAVMWCGVAGMGAFALVFFLMQRRSMMPERLDISPRSLAPLLKYGLPLIPAAVMQYMNTLFAGIYVNSVLGESELGVFELIATMSLALGVIQAGFSTFWSAFIFGSYATEQRRIRRVHDYLTFIILSFMCLMIAFRPVIFGIFGSGYRGGSEVFGIMMFAPLLLIISETTVYGIEIAKKTVYNSISVAVNIAVNVVLCIWLVPGMGLAGAAIALAASGLAAFVFRTIIAQRYYKSMDRPIKTAVSIALMAVLCAVSYLENAAVTAAASAALLCYYLVAYRAELRRCFSIVGEVLAGMRKKA